MEKIEETGACVGHPVTNALMAANDQPAAGQAPAKPKAVARKAPAAKAKPKAGATKATKK